MSSDVKGNEAQPSGELTPIDPAGVAALQAAALSDDLVVVMAGTFQVLGDPTRLKLLYALTQRPCCVRDLAIVVGVSESAVSHQLRHLKDRQLVQARREGQTVYYSLHDQHLRVFLQEAEFHADHVSRGHAEHAHHIYHHVSHQEPESPSG